jgi:transcription antitermination factor NusA-like protein
MNITLTPDQVKTVLNGLALAETQMEDADGKKEMKELGWTIHLQTKDPLAAVRKKMIINMNGGVIQYIGANFKDPIEVVLWDNDEPEQIRESFAIPEGMESGEYWDKVIANQYPYNVKF